MLEGRVLIGAGEAYIENSNAQATAVELGAAKIGRAEAGGLLARQQAVGGRYVGSSALRRSGLGRGQQRCIWAHLYSYYPRQPTQGCRLGWRGAAANSIEPPTYNRNRINDTAYLTQIIGPHRKIGAVGGWQMLALAAD
jgi:hypothetical protein